MDLKNDVTCRKFSDITLESDHLNYIRPAGRHFYFLWSWLGILCDPRHGEDVLLVLSYRSEKTAGQKSNPFGDLGGVVILLPPLGNGVYKESLGNGGLKYILSRPTTFNK